MYIASKKNVKQRKFLRNENLCVISCIIILEKVGILSRNKNGIFKNNKKLCYFNKKRKIFHAKNNTFLKLWSWKDINLENISRESWSDSKNVIIGEKRVFENRDINLWQNEFIKFFDIPFSGLIWQDRGKIRRHAFELANRGSKRQRIGFQERRWSFSRRDFSGGWRRSVRFRRQWPEERGGNIIERFEMPPCGRGEKERRRDRKGETDPAR